MRDLFDAFNVVYASSRWTQQGNKSGPGSDPRRCAPMWHNLAAFIKAERIRSITDVSCGGMAWWPSVLDVLGDDIEFYGYDVSQIITDENRARFADRANWHFATADARHFAYCSTDLFVCRHTLNHLWREDELAVLNNIFARAKRFVAFTSDRRVTVNPEDVGRIPLMPPRGEATRYTHINLTAAPFNLAAPVHRIPDVDGESLEIFLSTRKHESDCCIVSAFIGSELPQLRASPLPRERSFFWGNKPEFRAVVEAAGWTFIHDSNFGGDPRNEAQTSIRSKFFKFLQFLHQTPPTPVQNLRYVLWADAKRIPESRAAFSAFFAASTGASPGITIRTTPPLKETIAAEIAVAMGQPRYAATMGALRQLVQVEIIAGRARNEIRICNTGLILFDTANRSVHALNRLIHEATLATQNPECQVLFALYRQRFAPELVHNVSYELYPSVIS